jgi:hypothetical protein
MKIHGLPETFWVVTKPNRASELGDICFACTYKQLILQARGGLHEDDIVGIYANEADAKEMAGKLLGKNVVRTSDAILVEVMVTIQVMPTMKDITAKALSLAAVEAVGNAVRKAEQEGFQHRLKNQVAMGVGQVGLDRFLTLLG